MRRFQSHQMPSEMLSSLIGLILSCSMICEDSIVAQVVSMFSFIFRYNKFTNLLFAGSTKNLNRGFAGTTTSPKNLALAFYSGLWAYDGW